MTSQPHTCDAPPHLRPTSRLLLLHLLAICLFAPTAPLRLSFQLVSKKAAKKKKKSGAAEIFSERTPISDHTGGISGQERSRWEAKVGQAPFYKHGEGRGLCARASERVRACTCVPERGSKWATNCFIYTADKHPNTSISWETEKHRGTTDAIILLNKNAKQRRQKPAAAQETLYLTHIIDCKLIPKNLALPVLTHGTL